MTMVNALNYYFCANVLLIVSAVLVAFIKAGNPPNQNTLSYRTRLIWANAIVLSTVLWPVVSLISGRELSTHAIQVWAASSMQEVRSFSSETAVFAVASSPGVSFPLITAVQFWIAALAAGILVALGRVLKDAKVARKIIVGTQRLRVRGRLRILSSDEVTVPFSLWVPFRFFIVLPSSLILNPGQLRVALRHEAQHHRQIDTKLLYVYQGFKAVFFWNPAVHLLERWLRQLQEFACDEAVTTRGDIGREEYCHCLLQMAEAKVAGSRAALSASMAGNADPQFLRKRVVAVLAVSARAGSFWRSGFLIAIAVGVMGIAAIAFSSIVTDRRVSLETAGLMAEAAQKGSPIPISVNENVLRQLNVLLATPDGRALLHSGIKRMHEYEPLISSEIESNRLPPELLAVPLIESGYRNLPPGDSSRHGAGLWMFIEHTARRFGLTIEKERDERLDVVAQTKAAMRLFSELHAQFGDWGLAFLGYNMGSVRVENAIAETGSRDPWEIIAAASENDPQYLSRVMAAILIINDTTIN